MRFHDDSGARMDTYGLYILMFSCVEIVLFYIKRKKIILFIIDWKIILKDYFIIEWWFFQDFCNYEKGTLIKKNDFSRKYLFVKQFCSLYFIAHHDNAP